MQYRLTTNRFSEYGFREGMLLELLATRKGSQSLLFKIPLGAAMFPDLTILSAQYKRKEHLNGIYGWVQPSSVQKMPKNITNAQMTNLLSVEYDA